MDSGQVVRRFFNNFYYWDDCRQALWIVPPKCASTSIKRAASLGHYIDRDAALALNNNFTIAFVRHPWDRIISALYSHLRTFEPFGRRLMRALDNSHVRPQRPMLDGLRIDFLGRFDSLDFDWRMLQKRFALDDLPMTHVGRHRPKRWQDELFDWSILWPRYRRDFELCPDWPS